MTTKNRIAYTALPEQQQYRDTGCDVAPACLSCPLSACKHDDPAAYNAMKREQAFMDKRPAYERWYDVYLVNGRDAQAAAQYVGISRRHLNRVVRLLETPITY